MGTDSHRNSAAPYWCIDATNVVFQSWINQGIKCDVKTPALKTGREFKCDHPPTNPLQPRDFPAFAGCGTGYCRLLIGLPDDGAGTRGQDFALGRSRLHGRYGSGCFGGRCRIAKWLYSVAPAIRQGVVVSAPQQHLSLPRRFTPLEREVVPPSTLIGESQ